MWSVEVDQNQQCVDNSESVQSAEWTAAGESRPKRPGRQSIATIMWPKLVRLTDQNAKKTAPYEDGKVLLYQDTDQWKRW